MELPEAKALHKQCLTSLKNFIAEANRTCSLLESMTAFPVSLQLWERAVQQRIAENHAHVQYQRAREYLFAAIKPKVRIWAHLIHAADAQRLDALLRNAWFPCESIRVRIASSGPHEEGFGFDGPPRERSKVYPSPRYLYPQEIMMAPSQAGVYLLFAGEQVVRVSEGENLRDALQWDQEFCGASHLKPTHFAYSVILDREVRLQQVIEIIRFLSPTAQSL